VYKSPVIKSGTMKVVHEVGFRKGIYKCWVVP